MLDPLAEYEFPINAISSGSDLTYLLISDQFQMESEITGVSRTFGVSQVSRCFPSSMPLMGVCFLASDRGWSRLQMALKLLSWMENLKLRMALWWRTSSLRNLRMSCPRPSPGQVGVLHGHQISKRVRSLARKQHN